MLAVTLYLLLYYLFTYYHNQGKRTVHNILEAICTGIAGDLPDPCYRYHIYAGKDLDSGNDNSSTGLSWGTIFTVIFTVVVLNLLIILGCKIYMKKKMQSKMDSEALDDRITSAVSTYMQLRDKN